MKVLYILLALVVLLVLITVHELGHYIAGKVLGFKINEFSIGFGPAIFKRKKKDGEIFSVRALPLGGFCAFEGEDEDGKDNPEAFNSRPAWKRLIVLVSGVAFNFLFAVLTSAIYLMVTGYASPIIKNTVLPNETTGKGLQANDIVVAVDGKNIEAYRSFSDLLEKYEEGEEFTITVNRDGKIMDVLTKKQKIDAFYFVADTSGFEGKLFDSAGNAINIETFTNAIIRTPTAGESTELAGKGSSLETYLSGVYKTQEEALAGDDSKSYKADIATLLENDTIVYANAGVSLGVIQNFVPQKYGFFECLGKGWVYSFYLGGLIIESFIGLFTGAVAVSEAGGTITAISQMADISSWGIEFFLLLLPLLAMNLAVFNILPIPALDGARALFVLIELIFRKPVNRKVEGWIHTIGLFVLLALVIFLDINHFLNASKILLKLRI